MKSNARSKIIILITLGILFALSPIIITNLSFIDGISEKSTEYNTEINSDNEQLKISKISGKIHIDNNWSDAKTAGICTGSGTDSDPYVIEDLEIDGGGWGNCILIEHSDVYFEIEKCTLHNSGPYDTGIELNYVRNGKLSNNKITDSYHGIYLRYSNRNVISGNIADNNKIGIRTYRCINAHIYYSNNITGNTATNNELVGIYISYSDRNNIWENIANNNEYGIEVYTSDYNDISGNSINNNLGGIFLHGEDPTGARWNNIYLNCFNNPYNAYDNGSNNQWDTYVNEYNGSRGNYWSDYLGSDGDGDGIGDFPYYIRGSAGSLDNFPLVKCPISTQQGGIIPGYNLFFLLGILSVVVFTISKKIKKS